MSDELTEAELVRMSREELEEYVRRRYGPKDPGSKEALGEKAGERGMGRGEGHVS